MLPSRGLRISTRSISSNVPWSRQISSFAVRSRQRWPIALSQSVLSDPIRRSNSILPATLVSAPFAPRFQSSTPLRPPPELPTASSPAASSPLSTDSDLYKDLFEKLPNLDDVSVESVAPHIGYLHDYGMDFGWGPTSMIQWLLEHIHVYSGTPWWASILVTTLVVRAAMFYPFMRSSNEQAKIAAMKPALDALKDKYKKAKEETDPMAQQEATHKHALELRRLNAAFGISYPKMIAPMFFQMVAGFSSFRLLRNMTFANIPGLDNGGFLWLMDLTVADPYYTLPVISAGLMHLTARFGLENGSTLDPTTSKFMFYGMPAIMLAIVSFMPGAIQLTICLSGIIGFLQGRLLRWPAFRKTTGLLPMVKNVPIKQARSQDPRKQAVLDQRAKENSQQESISEKLKTAMGMPSTGSASKTAKADSKFGSQVKSYEERRREQLRREQDMSKRL